MGTSITFDEIERDTERTLGYAFLAKVATNFIVLLYRMGEVANGLDTLVKVLTPDKIRAFTPSQAESLTCHLQQIHKLLREVGQMGEIGTIQQIPLFSGRVDRLRRSSETVSDLIDDFVLIADPGFRRLISDCQTSIGI